MIDLLILQLLVTRAPAYQGEMVAYEAQCEVVMEDHRRQSMSFNMRGTGASRRVFLHLEGRDLELPVEVYSSSQSQPGTPLLSESFRVPEELGGFQYVLPFGVRPAPISSFNVWTSPESERYRFVGTGLCWMNGVDK